MKPAQTLRGFVSMEAEPLNSKSSWILMNLHRLPVQCSWTMALFIILYLRRLCRPEVHLQSHDFVVVMLHFQGHQGSLISAASTSTFQVLVPCCYHRYPREPSQETKKPGGQASFNTCVHSEDSARYHWIPKPRWWVWWALLIQGETWKCLFFMSAHASSTASQGICSKFNKKNFKKRCVTASIIQILYIWDISIIWISWIATSQAGQLGVQAAPPLPTKSNNGVNPLCLCCSRASVDRPQDVRNRDRPRWHGRKLKVFFRESIRNQVALCTCQSFRMLPTWCAVDN